MSAAIKPMDPWAGQDAGFNRAAASVVYKRMLAMDEDAALVFGRILVADCLRHDLIEHREVIGKALSHSFTQRFELIKSGLAATAVAKAREGGDNAAELAALVELFKAYGDDPYARNRHGEFAAQESRDYETHARIGYDSQFQTLKGLHARQQGIPEVAKESKLSAADRGRYQQAYRQVADMVAPYRGRNSAALSPLVHLQVEDAKGQVREEVLRIPAPHQEFKLGAKLKAGDTIRSAAVSVNARGAAGALYDPLAALGHPGAGAVAANQLAGGTLDAQRVREFGNEFSPQLATLEQANAPGSHRVFGRIGAGSKLLADSLGEAAPRKVSYALAVGTHVGTYGPEAQKVIGPSADRAAYRYRGTERTIDPRLGNAFESIRRDPTRPSAADKRELLLHGSFDTEGNWTPSGVLNYFGPKGPVLPKAELNTLQRKSGKIPPSQGVIIDARGRVAHQAVGFGDDWYLPFNLKNLKALRGGEYIRTRTFGGPTTEDLYTGLISGAQGMSVISHNGVYTVDFDNTLRGGRRFNDKAAAMVGRYGYLLDAVKNGQITTGGIHPSRLAELEQRAAEAGYDPVEDERGFSAELDKLKARELKRPQLSQAQRNAAAVDFLTLQAENVPTRDGHAMNADEMVTNLIEAQAGIAYRGHAEGARKLGVAPARDLDYYRSEQLNRLYHAGDNPEQAAAKVAAAMNKSPELAAHMARAEAENAAANTPLRLDGQGYALALSALQEQFPYYISRVEFHPWTDAHNATDTGYVKPRHNRPERVLAGYFDADVTGQGKALAHTVRFQNRAVHQDKVKAYVPARREQQQAAGEAGGAPGSMPKISEQTAAELRADADRGMLSHLLAMDTFPPAASMPKADGSKAEVGGLPVRQTLAQAPPNPLSHLFSEHAAIESRLGDPALALGAHEEIKAAYAYARDHNLRTDWNAQTVRSFQDEGRVSAPKPVPHSAAEFLSARDEINFGPHYLEGKVDSATAAKEYAENARTKALAGGALPASLDDPQFATRLGELERTLNARRAAANRAEAIGQPDRNAQAALLREAEGLARARQLHRRYSEAKAKEAYRPPAPQAAEEGVHTLVHNAVQMDPRHLAGMNREELAALKDNLGFLNNEGGSSGVSVQDYFDQADRNRSAIGP